MLNIYNDNSILSYQGKNRHYNTLLRLKVTIS